MNNGFMQATSNGVAFNNVEMNSQATVKPFNLRKLKASELFLVLNIFKKIGLRRFTEIFQNKNIQDVFTKIKDGEQDNIQNDEFYGVGSIIFEVAQITLEGLTTCETEIYTLLSQVSGMTIEQVKGLDIEIFIAMIIELVKENMGFLKAVSQYLK